MRKIICSNGDQTQFPLFSLLIQLKTVINVEKFGNPVKCHAFVIKSSSSSNRKCLSFLSRYWVFGWAFFKFSAKCSTSMFIPPVSVCVATEFRLVDDTDWTYTAWNCSGVSLVLIVNSLFLLTVFLLTLGFFEQFFRSAWKFWTSFGGNSTIACCHSNKWDFFNTAFLRLVT